LKDKSRISGKDATYVAREALKRRPIPLLASEGVEQPPGALVPSDGLEGKALLAVQIIATGFSGLRLLRQSQRQMTEEFIDVYGNYAIKLLRLQNDMIQTFDRYRRGNKQTVEVRHVHIHSGGQGVVGIINPPDDRDAGVRE
jgi:hypothetical protein